MVTNPSPFLFVCAGSEIKVGQRVFECPSSSHLPPQYLLAVELSISLVSKCGKFSRGIYVFLYYLPPRINTFKATVLITAFFKKKKVPRVIQSWFNKSLHNILSLVFLNIRSSQLACCSDTDVISQPYKRKIAYVSNCNLPLQSFPFELAVNAAAVCGRCPAGVANDSLSEGWGFESDTHLLPP